jgi:Fe-S cluster biogenesis protein NfuA
MSDIRVTAHVTPNPNTLKFLLDRQLFQSGTFNFETKESAKGSSLPYALFEITGIEGVMVGPNFVSVTKTPNLDWADVAEPIITTLKGVIANEDEYVDEALRVNHAASGSDSDDVAKIKSILDNEIRPAVAMDGGDIVFNNYTDGILTLQLQGACSSCPSSIMTLKMGIEARLKEEVSSLREVVQL